MNMKEHILTALREQFNPWEELLASLGDEKITVPHFDYSWSIKDVIAHVSLATGPRTRRTVSWSDTTRAGLGQDKDRPAGSSQAAAPLAGYPPRVG